MRANEFGVTVRDCTVRLISAVLKNRAPIRWVWHINGTVEEAKLTTARWRLRIAVPRPSFDTHQLTPLFSGGMDEGQAPLPPCSYSGRQAYSQNQTATLLSLDDLNETFMIDVHKNQRIYLKVKNPAFVTGRQQASSDDQKRHQEWCR